MIKVDQRFTEEILVQRIDSQNKEIEINYFQLGGYRFRDTHAIYHNIRLYRSFAPERVGDVFLLKRIAVEEPKFAEKISKNQLRVVGTPDKQIKDKILKCEYHWKDQEKHYFAFENPAYGMLSQLLEYADEVEEDQLNQTEIVFILKGILLALQQLHNQSVYHGNIKMSNIAICENFEIKLHDFSFSKYKNYTSSSLLKVSTPKYCMQSRKEMNGDGEKDIQAIGVILYYLLHQKIIKYNNKQSLKNKERSKIISGLQEIYKDLANKKISSIQRLLECRIFEIDEQQFEKTRQKLLIKYTQYRESLIQQKKWGRKPDKTRIKLSDQLLQKVRGDYKIQVIQVLREKESFTVFLSNLNEVKIKNKEISVTNSSKMSKDRSKYNAERFKELNCTVTKIAIVNNIIFIRLSNDLICISFSQKNITDEVLMILNYNRNNPSLIKIVNNQKERIFNNYKEALTQEPSLVGYVRTIFEKMLENSSISA